RPALALLALCGGGAANKGEYQQCAPEGGKAGHHGRNPPAFPKCYRFPGRVSTWRVYFSGNAQANITPPPLVITYWRPSSSYVMGELCMFWPWPACQSVLPSLVRSASTLPCASPVKIRPEPVVSTPAPAPLGPSSWLHLILPV